MNSAYQRFWMFAMNFVCVPNLDGASLALAAPGGRNL
jgi:hypothetical protein